MKKLDGRSMSTSKFLNILCVLFLSLLASIASNAQSFQAKIDRTNIELGDTVNLSYTYNGEANRQSPDFALLKNNFDILSYYPSYSEINNNGKLTKLSTWELVLEPKTLGEVLIPPISFMGTSSKAIKLTVNKPSSNPTSGKEIFLETIVDKSTAYVQEQITVTYRLYYSLQIEAEPEAPAINDVVIQNLDPKQYQRRIDGKLYRVAEVPFVIFPQRSGTLVIPQTTWQIRVAKAGSRPSMFGSFGRYELRKLRSQEKVLRIKSIPDTFPKNATWLPAKSLTATQSWSEKDLAGLSVGEPITRTIKVEGQGIEAAQIPVFFEESADPGLKTYLEPAQLSDGKNEFGLVGSRTESAAIVLAEPGAFQLPSIEVPWWNTDADRLETLVIAESSLEASSSGESLASDITSTNPALLYNDNSFKEAAEIRGQQTQLGSGPSWVIYLLSATNIVLLLIIIFLLTRRKTSSASKTKRREETIANPKAKLLTMLNKHIGDQNLDAAYETLQLIARDLFGLQGITELKYLAEKHGEQAISASLATLEGSLFSNQTLKSGEKPSKLVDQLRSLLKAQKPVSKTNLAEVY